MPPDTWVRCEICRARMKADRLDEHLAEVHPRGAQTSEERARVLARRDRLKRLGIGALIVMGSIGLVLAGYAVTQLGERTPTSLMDEGDPFLGSQEANLTMYLFEDYQCPHCRSFELGGAFDHIVSEWVDPGTVRVVFKDLAFIGEDSLTAAGASHCVWEEDPEAWLGWHRWVFEHQGPERSGWASQENLVELARAWGEIPIEPFTSCLEDGAWRDGVEQDAEQARSSGVSGTPTIVIGDRVVNAMDTDEVDRAIRAALGTSA